MRLTYLLFFLTFSGSLFSQTPIQFTNPSFEDTPQAGKTPRGWYNCGQKGESPPDVQPNNQFKVTTKPYDGNSYLGMVVRDNETFEAVGQRLKKSIVADSTYVFGIYLARSPYYVSLSRVTRKEVNYATGSCLRIWGGNEYCGKGELLYNSGRINNAKWLLHNIKFTPKETYEYLLFEVYYVTPTLFAYNGNLLLDNITIDKTLLESYPETESEIPTLQREILAIENMIEFSNYAKEDDVFRYFDSYSTDQIKLLVVNFQDFELYESAQTLENLIIEMERINLLGEDATDDMFTHFQNNCKDIDKVLIADKFDEKIDAFIEKHKDELKLLMKD